MFELFKSLLIIVLNVVYIELFSLYIDFVFHFFFLFFACFALLHVTALFVFTWIVVVAGLLILFFFTLSFHHSIETFAIEEETACNDSRAKG